MYILPCIRSDRRFFFEFRYNEAGREKPNFSTKFPSGEFYVGKHDKILGLYLLFFKISQDSTS